MMEYLSNPKARCPITQASDLSNPEIVLATFKYRAAFLIAKAVHNIDVEQKTWNDMLVDIYRISRAHCQLVLVSNFIKAVFGPNAPISNENRVLQKVAILFAVSTLEQEMADFLTSGYVSPEQSLIVKERSIQLLKELRPDVVALVDAFGFPDYLLQSSLGAQDGDVYTRITRAAELEPLNQKKVADGYEEYIKPFVHGGQGKWKIGKDGIARL